MKRQSQIFPMPPPHSSYWATCEECEIITRELEAEGLTRSDAQACAEAEHMETRSRIDAVREVREEELQP